MKKIVLHTLVISLFTAISAHAIAGLGFHYAPNFGAGVKSTSADILGTTFTQEESFGMQGVGTKLWIDIIPIIDIEATANMQWLEYSADLGGAAIEAETGLPLFAKAKPMFALVVADLTITYPFFSIPKIIKFYAGAGYSHIFSPKVLNNKFMTETAATAFSEDPAVTPDGLVTAAGNALKDESFNSGAGGHVILGARTQLPLIPFDFYLNGKYHFGGAIDDAASHGVTVEIGGGFSL